MSGGERRSAGVSGGAQRNEVAIGPALPERILRLARPEAVLVGGQAHYPHEKALTALAGQVTKNLPGGDYVNIDVLFRLHGDVTTSALRARAASVELGAVSFKVLHPMDVLQGRLDNLYSLAEKQNEQGVAQLELAVTTLRAFIAQEATRGRGDDVAGRRPVVLKHLGRVAAMARSDAGRKVARRHKVHVADVLDARDLASAPEFIAKELPLLAPLMSRAWRRVQGL